MLEPTGKMVKVVCKESPNGELELIEYLAAFAGDCSEGFSIGCALIYVEPKTGRKVTEDEFKTMQLLQIVET